MYKKNLIIQFIHSQITKQLFVAYFGNNTKHDVQEKSSIMIEYENQQQIESDL
jgi:hypothetical protein